MLNDTPLDTSRWNLFASRGTWPIGIAVAAIACGPVVGGQDGGGEGDATTEATSATEVTSTDPTQGCSVNADCGYGYDCVNGVCEYTCGCGCYGEAPAGSQPRCAEGWYGCYSDEECAPGEVCDEVGQCVPGTSEDCRSIPGLGETLELQFSDGLATPVGALAFAEVSAAPGTELLVARGNTIELISEGVGTIVVQTPTPVVAFATADLDGDLVLDLVTAEQGAEALVRVWHNADGVFVPTDLVQPLVDARALAVGDVDGDANPDVYAHVGRDVVVFPWIDGAPMGVPQALLIERVDVVAVLDTNADGTSDVVFGEADEYWLYGGARGGEPLLIGGAQGPNIDRLLAADFSGDGLPDVAGFGTPILTTFVGEVPLWGKTSSRLAAGYTAVGAGDIDGDGRADLVFTQSDTTDLVVRYGADAGLPKTVEEPYRCDTVYTFAAASQALAVGDLDGDGLGEVAISDGTRVMLLRF